MAVVKKEKEEEVNESIRIFSNILKANKDDHYNFEDTIYYKVPSTSMLMNSQMDGGLEPGAHRFIGAPSGGKTSAALDYMLHFLKGNDDKFERRGIYFRCEGKLSPNSQKRSGIKFVEKEEEWLDGTCIIVDSNVFEFVFQMIRDLLQFNKAKCKYFFILDSLDMMAKKDDLAKPFADSQQVASGAVLTSVFFKKVSIALSKRGHYCILISQVRDTIKINTYEKTNPKQGAASGGHAVEHAAGWVLDFQPRWETDIIREGDEKKAKPIGHYAKCKIVKSDNESYLREIKYPIRYGQVDGKSVWREKEVLDLIEMWELIARPEGKGQMYYPNPNFINDLTRGGFTSEEKFRGIGAVGKWLDDNPAIVDFLSNDFRLRIEQG
jgi:RecA/RadA recombinase